MIIIQFWWPKQFLSIFWLFVHHVSNRADHTDQMKSTSEKTSEKLKYSYCNIGCRIWLTEFEGAGGTHFILSDWRGSPAIESLLQHPVLVRPFQDDSGLEIWFMTWFDKINKNRFDPTKNEYLYLWEWCMGVASSCFRYFLTLTRSFFQLRNIRVRPAYFYTGWPISKHSIEPRSVKTSTDNFFNFRGISKENFAIRPHGQKYCHSLNILRILH